MLSELHKLHGIKLEDCYVLGTSNVVEGRNCGSFYDTSATFNWKSVETFIVFLVKECVYLHCNISISVSSTIAGFRTTKL